MRGIPKLWDIAALSQGFGNTLTPGLTYFYSIRRSAHDVLLNKLIRKYFRHFA
jgi:hypothetical protein